MDEFCTRLAHATGSHIGALMAQDMQGLGGRLDLLVGADAHEAALYEEEFAGDNLWLQRGARHIATGKVLNSDDVVSRTELRSSRYYNEYLRRADVEQSVALCALFDGRNVVTATVCRSGSLKPYGANDLGVLRQVAPHWVNAYALQRRLGWLEQRVQSLEASLDHVPMAMFLLDRSGRAVRANEAAEHLLIAGRLVPTPAGLSAPGDDAAPFRALVQAAAAGRHESGREQRQSGTWILRNPQGTADLVAAAHPLPVQRASAGEAAVLFVQPVTAEPDSSLASLLRRAFGLTGSEATLACALYARADLAEAARTCGVTMATARTRLQSIYGKTGEHGQAALMRLLAAMAIACAER